jgi:hypothetical protein
MKKAASEAEHAGAADDAEADQEPQGVTDAENEVLLLRCRSEAL